MRLFIERFSDLRDRHDVAVTFLPLRGAPVQLTGAEVLARANAVARRLVPGEPVLIVCPPGPDFVVAMIGALIAGAIVVPAYPPAAANHRRALARLGAILGDIRPTRLLRTTAQVDLFPDELGLPEALEVDTLEPTDAFEPTPVPGDAVCLLQYTSGSTSTPRGVRLTQANLTHNIGRLAEEDDHDGRSIVCSWVPPYHDMGLIGGILYPLSSGGSTVLMPPEAVLARPQTWFQVMAHFGVTTSSAPPFALDRCVDRATPDPSLDLSRLRTLIVASEPLSARTLSAFTRTFAPCGLAPSAVRPAYGLAEATLWVTGVAIGELPKLHDGIVSCGTPKDELCIVGEDGELVPDGVSGEIWLRSPSVADGYENHPDGPFGHTVPGRGTGWLRTGDLGCVHEGELYVHGRIKDVITQRGVQHHAHDLEQTIALACADVQERRVVAFADLRPGEAERLVVLVELVEIERPTPALVASIREALSAGHAIGSSELVFVEKHSIRWTTSGKKARAATRSAWQNGRLATREVEEAPPSEADDNALYPHLARFADALDARQLAYRYDLENDLPWEQAGAPGQHLSESLVASLFSEFRPLLDDPERRDFVQWALGLATCEVTAWLEASVVAFVHRQSHAIGGERASLVAMVHEEHKHMAMFQRYADHLRAQRPAEIPAYEAAFADAIARVPDPSLRGDQPPEWHFAAWVRLLIFEEWSVWFYARLKGAPDVQPLWLAIHNAHAREEIQHVRTDAAWIDALELDTATRNRIVRGLPLDVMRRIQLVNHVVRSLCEARWPEVRLPQPDASRPLVALLRDPAFRYTRSVAPELVKLVERGLPRDGEVPTVQRVPTASEALSWLEAWVTARRKVVFDADASFAELGMDSVDRLDLSGALDAWLGGELPSTLTYELPTPRLLAEHLSSLAVRTDEDAIDVEALERVPVGIRQARWLDGVPAEGRCHNVVGAWVAPQGTAPDALFAALETVAAAHPALGRRFERTGSGWWQVRSASALALTRETCAGDLEHDLRQRIEALSATPWHPERDPTFQAVVVAGAGACGLVWSAPHCVADAGSRLVLVQSLAAALRGVPLAPPDPAVLALQERAWLASPTAEARHRWWRSELAGLPATSEPRPGFRGRVSSRRVAPERAARWLEGRTETPFVHLLAAFARAWQATRGIEAVIGTQFGARSTARRREMFGYLNDVVVVRPRLTGALDTASAAERVARAWEQGVQRLVPVDDIVRHAWPDRWTQRWLPAPVSFNYVPLPEADAIPEGWRRVTTTLRERSFLFYEEMLLVTALPEGSLSLTYWFDSDTVTEAAARETLDAFERLLDVGDRAPVQVPSEPQQPLA